MSYDNDWEPRSLPETPQSGQSYPPSQYELDNQSGSKSGGRTLLWVIGILAAIGFTGIAVCCGTGYFAWTIARQELAKQVRQQIAGSPEIAEHVGDVESVAINLTATQRSNEPGKMVFDVQGSRGSAQLAVDMSSLDRPDQAEAYLLILPDGQRIPLTGLSGTAREVESEPPPDASLPSDAPVPAAPSEIDPPAENEANNGRILTHVA